MFEYITGKLTFINPYYIVIETTGIGYQIAVANPFRYSAKEQQEIKVYVHQVVREDAQTLYGFDNLQEKQLFLRLISVSGIGPKSALAILAADDHAGLVQAIEGDQAAYLTKFPGVGKKTAQQLILDLKGKLGELNAGTMQADDGLPAASPVNADESFLDEALEALEALGYSVREIKRIEPQLKQQALTSTDAYLRAGLKLMMKK